jgi:polyisoprenoid-binding protein YceI
MPRFRACVQGEERVRLARRPATPVSRLLPIVAALMLLAPAQAMAETVFTVAPGSRLTIVTRRAGPFSALAHEHALEDTALSGRVAFDPAAGTAPRTSGEIVIDATRLAIDTPAVRQAAGLGEGPSGGDPEQIGRTLHGPEGLDTSRFPVIRFLVTQADTAAGAGPGRADLAAVTRLTGQLTLHGQTRAVTLPVEIERAEGGWLVRGRTEIRQTDFGIRPASVAGGLVKVQDEAEVSVSVRLVEESAPPDERP